MVDLAKLDELIARVEKATGPSEELDTRIRAALFAPEVAYVEQSPFNFAWVIYNGEWNGKPRLFERPVSIPHEIWRGAYTRSIDAALGLVERMLPGWAVSHIAEDWTSPPKKTLGWTADIEPADNSLRDVRAQAPTLPLAIILALLHALRESSERGR